MSKNYMAGVAKLLGVELGEVERKAKVIFIYERRCKHSND